MADKKDYKVWSKEIRTPDGITKTLRVEEIENGFLITLSKFGEGKDGDWTDAHKKVFSKENPFESEPKDKESENLESMKVFSNDLFDLI